MHENVNLQNLVEENDKALVYNKDVAVIKDKFIVLFIDKKVEETIAGIANKMTKGFVIPPVKKISTAN